MNGLQLSMTDAVQHLIPISGKDSLVTALVQTTRQPELPYRFLFNDTGSELPETYAWLDLVQAKTSWKIERTSVTIQDKLTEFGGFLPSHQNRWCTRETKIQPMDELLGHSPAYVYFGLRADEPERVGYLPTRKNNLLPVYPLRELGLGLDAVMAIVEAQDLMPPDFRWTRLESEVLNLLPAAQWFRELKQWEYRQLFAGRSRSNCFHCFYQRLYEWLWLRETHPDLFAKARGWEKPGEFTWNRDHPLSDFDDPDFRDRVFDRRVKQLTKILSGDGRDSDSEISGTSCGLICGK